MKNNAEAMFDGAIPGENLTSDPKNYPWHRPPDLIDYDEVVEYMISKVMEPQALNALMAFIGAGYTISSLVSYGMLSTIGKGKFQIDMAILAAGPIARLLQILAEDAGIEYNMGVDDDFKPLSATMLRLAEGDTDIIPDEEAQEPAAEPAPDAGGLMDQSVGISPATEDEQAAMLGYGSADEEVLP